jgi:hypothetical protein
MVISASGNNRDMSRLPLSPDCGSRQLLSALQAFLPADFFLSSRPDGGLGAFHRAIFAFLSPSGQRDSFAANSAAERLNGKTFERVSLVIGHGAFLAQS